MVTGGYRSYRGFEGMTGGYKGLPEITRDFMGLERLIEGYKG